MSPTRMTLALFAILAASPCSAQMFRSGDDSRTLGGYGGAILDTRSEIGTTATLIPYGGTFAGFMPYRMGGGARSLSFEPRERTGPDMNLGRTPFRLAPMTIGRGLDGSSAFPLPRNVPLRRMGVMPPNFGSPFRQPPSLIGPATSGAGMSM